MIPERLFYERAFALVAILLVGYLLYLVLAPFFAPIAWALFIAFLLHPLQLWLTRRLRGRAALSSTILVVVTVVVVLGPLAALGAAFAAQLGELARHAQAYAVEHKPSDLSDLGACRSSARRSPGCARPPASRSRRSRRGRSKPRKPS
jgi:predicted PurR-regulated permease PerM